MLQGWREILGSGSSCSCRASPWTISRNGTETEELICVLDLLATVLESDGDTHWSFWMRKARARLLDSDYSGIEYLRSAYGGLGSLNDLVLGQSYDDGVFSWKPGHVELNEKFVELHNKTAQLADAIRRSQA